MTALRLSVLALLALSQSGLAQDPKALAWIRFDQSLPEAQEYRGVSYLWLGRAEIHLKVDVRPHLGHCLEFSWGAKGDTRDALLTVNRVQIPLKAGGYDGFEPLRIPVPGQVKGWSY